MLDSFFNPDYNHFLTLNPRKAKHAQVILPDSCSFIHRYQPILCSRIQIHQKLLVITESKGFVHGVVKRPKPEELCLVEKSLIALGKSSGMFEAVVSQDSRTAITAENLQKYDAVFFYTTGELPLSDVQKADLLQYIKSGKGFSGSHCATDTFYKWPEYGNMIGAYFDGHPWHEKIKVKVEDKNHPATKHLGDSFEITDEIYQFKGPYDRKNLNILLSMDTTAVKRRQTRRQGLCTCLDQRIWQRPGFLHSFWTPR